MKADWVKRAEWLRGAGLASQSSRDSQRPARRGDHGPANPPTLFEKDRHCLASARCLGISLPAGYVSGGGRVNFCVFRGLMTSAEIFPFLWLFVAHPGPNGPLFIPKLPKDGLLTDCFQAFWSRVRSGTKHLFSASLSRRLCAVCGRSTARLA